MKLFLFLNFITLLIGSVIGNVIVIDDSKSIASAGNSTVSKSTNIEDNELATSVVSNSTKIEDNELATSVVSNSTKNNDNELADSVSNSTVIDDEQLVKKLYFCK